MEDDDLLYSGLPNYSHHKNIEELENSQKQLEELVSSLKEQVTKLTAENEELSKKCTTLSKNISSVIKTARSEIKRKDNRISELNKEVLFLKTKGKSKVLPKTSAYELEQRVRDRKKQDFEREEKIVKIRGRERCQSRFRDNLNSPRRKRSGDKEDELPGRKRYCDSSKDIPSENHVDNSLKIKTNTKIDKCPSDTFTESFLSDQVSSVQNTSSVIDKNDRSLNSPTLHEQSTENKIPNIPMYTLYSQRMFNKLYNLDQPKKPESNVFSDNGRSSNEVNSIHSNIGSVAQKNIDVNLNENSSSENLDNSTNLLSSCVKNDSTFSLKSNEPQLLVEPAAAFILPVKNTGGISNEKLSSKLQSDLILSKRSFCRSESDVLNPDAPCTQYPADDMDIRKLLNKPIENMMNIERETYNTPTSDILVTRELIKKPTSEVMSIEVQYDKSKSDVLISEKLSDKSKLDANNTKELCNTFESDVGDSNKSCNKTKSYMDKGLSSNNPKFNIMNIKESPFIPKSLIMDTKEPKSTQKPVTMNTEELPKKSEAVEINAEGLPSKPKSLKEEDLLKDIKMHQAASPLPSLKISNVNNVAITSDKENQMNNETELSDLSPISKSDKLSSNKVDIPLNIESGTINSLNVTDVSKNIQITELKDIITNLDQCNNLGPTEQSNFPGQCSSIIQNIDSSKTKDDFSLVGPNKIAAGTTNLQKHCTMSLGLKLTNRQSKTTFNPISSQWNETCKRIVENDTLSKNKNNYNEPPKINDMENSDNNDGCGKDDLIEALFGSPLKWSENSTDEISPKLCPPASAFEDSCSAQIENAKFKKLSINTTESVTSKKTVKEIIVSKNAEDISTMTIESRISFQKLKEKRPFEQVNNGKNEKPTISSYLQTTETSDIPSFKMTTLSGSLKSMTSSPIVCPKYQDSILGQFDDTTQLISALAKEHSTISPIHTPIKEKKSESPDKKPIANLPLPIEANKLNFSQNISGTQKCHPFSRIYKKQEKKTILLDKPINILCPRRKVREDGKPKASPNQSVRSSPVVSSDSKRQTKDINKKKNETVENKNTLVEEDKTSKVQYFQTKKQESGEKDSSRLSFGKASTERDSQVNYERREIESSSQRVSNGYKLYYDERGRKKVSFTTISSKTSMSNFSPSPRKINSPVESSRTNRSSNNATFKRPLSYERSHRRSNCVFRETSVERKILRDNRHRIQRTPSRVAKRRDLERYSARNSLVNGSKCPTSSSFATFRNHVKPENNILTKPTHIVRPSKKISWSASTTEVISAQPSQNISSPKTESKMKWILQPIDLDNNQSSIYSKKIEENQQGKNSITSNLLNSPVLEKASNTPVIEQEKGRTPHKSPVVIISRKRPVRFGVSEMSAQFFKTVKHE